MWSVLVFAAMSAAARLEEVKEEVKEVRARLRQLNKKSRARVARATLSAPGSRRDFGADVATEIARRSGSVATATVFLKEHWCRRSRAARTVTAEAAQSFIAASLLRAAPDSDDSLSPWDKRTRDAAASFLEEQQLATWVRQQNATKGLAPSGTAVWGEFAGGRLDSVTDSFSSERAAPPKTVRTRNQWLTRWARRWGFRRGSFQSGDVLTPATLRRKALWGLSETRGLKVTTRFEKRGAEKRPQTWGRLVGFTLAGHTKSDPPFFKNVSSLFRESPRIFGKKLGLRGVAVARLLGEPRACCQQGCAPEHGREQCAIGPTAPRPRLCKSEVKRGEACHAHEAAAATSPRAQSCCHARGLGVRQARLAEAAPSIYHWERAHLAGTCGCYALARREQHLPLKAQVQLVASGSVGKSLEGRGDSHPAQRACSVHHDVDGRLQRPPPPSSA